VVRRTLRTTLVLSIAMLITAGCANTQPENVDVGGGAPTTTTAPAQPTDSVATGSEPAAGPAPQALRFQARTVAGEPFDAATLAGKPVALWFWAAWCTRCNAAADDIKAVQTQFAGKAHVVGVAGLGSGSGPMREFVSRHGISAFPHLADDDGAVYRSFGVTSQDTFVVLDSAGKTIHKGPLTGQQLADRLKSLTN
jgi:peroxiredoxin